MITKTEQTTATAARKQRKPKAAKKPAEGAPKPKRRKTEAATPKAPEPKARGSPSRPR